MRRNIGSICFGVFNLFKNTKSVTLVELMVSILAVSIMILSFYSLETYSHKQVMAADRRSKVQNSLSYCLEHMTKYVQQANGNYTLGYPAISLYPTGSSSATATGFQVRVDMSIPQTPLNFADDVMVYYTLSGNILTSGCTGTNCPASFTTEELSKKLVAGFEGGAILPASPTEGFYVDIDYLGTSVDIGLVGRFYPEQNSDSTSRLTNPQVAMRAKLICNNSSTN